ncbi:very long chain fatty acid elongase AAEL008004 isoform X2 [Parasteatoda tepidariorum]|uniref:very long chain fatty acid elongase AAEL008004 isoform X2 n=1 Tax=Parasteatoda tepidariorum TaxID=114398 RepID=UPI0039BD80B5
MATEIMDSHSHNITVDVDYVLKYGDPRVISYPLMDSPYKTYAGVIIFLIYIKIIGPKMMKNRNPYDLRTPMLLYNIVLVALSGWMFYRMLEAFYVYYISKFIEFLDTIFFVLRKKNSQITFLHLFHHAIMPITTWHFVKYGCGGYVTVLPLTNTFAHIVMYSYYLLSSLGPSVQKYIWWKRHVTNVQMIQFIVIMAATGLAMIIRPENCNLRFFTAIFGFLHGLVFFCLFTPFYINQYMKKKETK